MNDCEPPAKGLGNSWNIESYDETLYDGSKDPSGVMESTPLHCIPKSFGLC